MGAGRRLLGDLKRRPLPVWWSDAKLGIFIHWTLASVPGFATPPPAIGQPLVHVPGQPLAAHYTEWYENALRFPDSAASAYHAATYGDRPYASFADDFSAGLEQWDPDEWAARFAAAGARYVVLVTKHHDGFCLWPSEVRNPHRAGWHTSRDVVGELAAAVRARGMRFGAYYSGGLDWTFDDRPIGTIGDMLAAVPSQPAYADYAEAQVRELVERYRPSVLWNDIVWPFGGERLWRLFADYHAAVPDGVVNDRWMPRSALFGVFRTSLGRDLFNRAALRSTTSGRTVPPAPPYFDVRTPEYSTFDEPQRWPWETCRGMDHSFGFNRTSTPDDFLARDELLEMVTDIVAKGGNLLLNVGPRGEDAALPDEQRQRLDWLGEWMATATDALVGTRPWVRQEGTSPEGHRLRYTAQGDDVHVIVLDGPDGQLTLTDVALTLGGDVRLAAGGALRWSTGDDGMLLVDLGGSSPAAAPVALTITAARARAR